MNGLGAAWKGLELPVLASLEGTSATAKPESASRRRQTAASNQRPVSEPVEPIPAISGKETLEALAWRSASVPMRLTDERGITLEVNDAYCGMVGRSRSDLVGQPFAMVYAGSFDVESFANDLAELANAGGMRSHRGNKLVLATGRAIDADVTHTVIRTDNTTRVMLSMFETDRPKTILNAAPSIVQGAYNARVAERTSTDSNGELLKAHLAIKDLAAQKERICTLLSRDVRLPFGSILGFCEILLGQADELSPEEHAQFVGYIKEATNNQLQLVDKVLHWTRLGSTATAPKEELHDLSRLAEECLNGRRSHAELCSVSLTSALPSGMKVRGDADLLMEAIDKIIDNGLKFTPPDGSITLEAIPGDSREWQVEIRDTGIGIALGDCSALFRLGETSPRRGLHGEAGVGLGLPVVHEILRMHHGSVSVESETGKGTSVVLRIPNPSGRQGLN